MVRRCPSQAKQSASWGGDGMVIPCAFSKQSCTWAGVRGRMSLVPGQGMMGAMGGSIRGAFVGTDHFSSHVLVLPVPGYFERSRVMFHGAEALCQATQLVPRGELMDSMCICEAIMHTGERPQEAGGACTRAGCDDSHLYGQTLKGVMVEGMVLMTNIHTSAMLVARVGIVSI